MSLPRRMLDEVKGDEDSRAILGETDWNSNISISWKSEIQQVFRFQVTVQTCYFPGGRKTSTATTSTACWGWASAVHFDFMRCLQTCRLQWFQLWWLQFPFGLGQVLLVLLLLWLEHMAVHLQALSKKTSWCTKWPGLSCTSTWSYFSYWFFIWLLTFGPFHAAFMQLSYSGLRFCWEVQQEWAGRILQWDSWWMVLWQATSSFCPADVFVLYNDNDLVCHFASYSFKEVWSTGYLQQWQQAMMMVAWQKRRGWWHDAGRGRFAMPAMPLRSCPAECEARCMDLPRGLMCFHLRYMLFFVFFALESLNCKKDCERSWKMWNLPGKYKVCFFCARFSVVMLPLAARFRVQKCGHDILQGPSSFVVETFCMKVFMKNCPFPTRRHLQLQLQLHRWALLVVGSPIISWIREALTLQANGKFTSQLGSLIADRAL